MQSLIQLAAQAKPNHQTQLSSKAPNVSLGPGRFKAGCIAVLFVGTLATTGCGPSKEEMMMRAAMRARPTSDGEKEEDDRPASSAQVASTKTAAVAPATDPVGKGANASEEDEKATEPATASAEPAKLSIRPIDERRPAQTPDENERRRIAAENVTKIADAFLAFKKERKFYPPAAMTSSTRVPTLSWRVRLLPYLGYEELYKKFDPNLPWNRGVNKELLQYIPDEYVSPKRYDTKTNWMVPASRNFMFGENRSPVDRRIDDGIDSTIMLVEVRDELAVPWTQPKDFAPADRNQIKEQLGNLRGDGTFAAWANGWTTLLGAQLSNTQLYNAMTYESGDGQQAGQIHREIEAAAVVSAGSSSGDPVVTEVTSSTNANLARTHGRYAPTVIASQPLPSEEDLEQAHARIRDIYAKNIRDAEQPADHSRLSQDMLRQASQLQSDPAGAFAMLSAAMRQAIEGNNIRTLLQAVDLRIQQFDVDPYETNLDALLAFAEEQLRSVDDSRRSPVRSAKEFSRRALLVMSEGLKADDYDGVSRLAAVTARMQEDKKPNRRYYAIRSRNDDDKDDPQKRWNRLRSLVTSTKRKQDLAAEQIAKYRADPTNMEAASTVGRFLCFIKGDWDLGLPLLADSGIAKLGDVAHRDLRGASDPAEQTELGDMWWELSRHAKAGVYRQGAIDRAAHWYQMAGGRLPDSLEKIHVQARLDEIAETEPGTPTAALRQLADDMRINLNATLQQVAMGSVRSTHDDDDDD